TRFTVPDAARAMSTRDSALAPVGSIALTSACEASHGPSSSARPVRTFATPPGTSDVARTSDSVMAGIGRSALLTTTAVHPVANTGASTLTRPSSDDDCGASTPTRPVGSGTVNEKYGPATGFAAPRTLATLSVQPAYHTHLSIEASTTDDASAAEMPSHADTSAANWARRPSSISATRYST